MKEMIITDAQYVSNEMDGVYAIKATIDGVTMRVPLSLGNRHYAEIMRQVEAGELTIQDAE